MSLDSLPRIRLAALPTPLEEAPRLRAALGGSGRAPRILIKRDDLTGLAFGGNKARKLEFLVADAVGEGATALVTSGAVQSNHARMSAAAARVAGLKPVLVLTGKAEPPPAQGNLLIDYLFGAEVHFVPPHADPKMAIGDQEAAVMARVVDELRRRGERPYVVPIGGSSPVGALGYVAATRELAAQLRDMGASPARFYYASGSRGTQAGLALGAKLYGTPYQLYGIAVSGGEPQKTERALRVANEAAALLGAAARVSREDLVTDQAYFGDGYGIPTVGCLEAMRLLAHHEGILLDPVYTAKAMAGLIDHIRRGEIDPDDTVVFLHTGGTPALFAYADRLGLA